MTLTYVNQGTFFPFKISNFNLTKKIFLAETLITVRALGWCIETKLQEFARIIFVDNFETNTRQFEDHEPLKIRPDYTDVSKIVKSYKLLFNLLKSSFP